jgi:hypothetical protein
MRDDVSRLVGIEGLAVTGVIEVGRRLELEVELVARAGCCRWCGPRVAECEGSAGRARARSAGRRPGDVLALAQAPLSLRGVRAHVQRVASAAAGAPARQRTLSRASVRALPDGRCARRGRARGMHDALPGRAGVLRRRRRAVGATRAAPAAAPVARRSAPSSWSRACHGGVGSGSPPRGRGARRAQPPPRRALPPFAPGG